HRSTFHISPSTHLYALSLDDAVPIFTELTVDCADTAGLARFWCDVLGYTVREAEVDLVTIGDPSDRAAPVLTFARVPEAKTRSRSEEHTSELQSRENLVCRLLLEKKK